MRKARVIQRRKACKKMFPLPPANEGGEDAKRGGDGGEHEFGVVDDICVYADVEP